MRSACFVLLISAVALAAEASLVARPHVIRGPLDRKLLRSADVRMTETEEFKNLVNYLNENASGNDLYEMIEGFSETLDDLQSVPSSDNQEVIQDVDWLAINQYIEKKFAGDAKFNKLYEMVNDPNFRELLERAVVAEEKGFTWGSLANFGLKAFCETAIVSQSEIYSEGACKNL